MLLNLRAEDLADIPYAAGVQDDTVLRIPLQGDLPEEGTQKGDIYVVVAVSLVMHIHALSLVAADGFPALHELQHTDAWTEHVAGKVLSH